MSDAVTTLFTAIHANNPEGVRLLVRAEPELLQARSPSGLSPVMFAAYYQRPYVLDVLLAAGPELDVFEAAATGQPLPEGADVNAFNPDGFTPLHLAAMFGRTEAARALLGGGADLHALSRNPQAASPLHSALGGRQWETARLLLEQGADSHAAQPGGWTPLLLAVREGAADLVAELLTRGADPPRPHQRRRERGGPRAGQRARGAAAAVPGAGPGGHREPGRPTSPKLSRN